MPDFVLPPGRGHEGGQVPRDDLVALGDLLQGPDDDASVQGQVEAGVRYATTERNDRHVSSSFDEDFVKYKIVDLFS